MTKKGLLGVLAAASVGMASTASAVPVSYEIGSYSAGNYSASWVHGATGCSGTNSSLPGGGPLYMCGDPILPVSGIIEGDLIGGFLNITGGSLLIDGVAHAVGTGSYTPDFLSSVFGAAFGGFEIEDYGYFIYEPFNMGPGMPNYFDGNEMILWGQNVAAYLCTPDEEDSCHYGPRWGIDIYGQRITVPEPGVLGLFGFGLLALAATRRRKTVNIAR